MEKVLITGGAGYIGIHIGLNLINNGYKLSIFDNFENSSPNSIDRLSKYTNTNIKTYEGDLRSYQDIYKTLLDEKPDYIVHCAALKNVSDSSVEPIKYYENNVCGSINLIKAMKSSGSNKIVFSSTAAVYGNSEIIPITEKTPINPLSPYGKSKYMVEQLLEDSVIEGIKSIRLRYFNVAGADKSGFFGEDATKPLNVIPRLFQALSGQWEMKLFGNKFNTKDGTQERDYIHVSDLADAHVKSLSYFKQLKTTEVFNLSSGKPTSNLELIRLVEKYSGKKVNYTITDPKPGDPVVVYSEAKKANKLLKWRAKRTPEEIIKDTNNWYKNNPDGYSK